MTATVHFIGERPPVEYVVRVRHHYNGAIELVVEGVGNSEADRKSVSEVLLEAAAFVLQPPEQDQV